jgi:hypothetical protein
VHGRATGSAGDFCSLAVPRPVPRRGVASARPTRDSQVPWAASAIAWQPADRYPTRCPGMPVTAFERVAPPVRPSGLVTAHQPNIEHRYETRPEGQPTALLVPVRRTLHQPVTLHVVITRDAHSVLRLSVGRTFSRKEPCAGRFPGAFQTCMAARRGLTFRVPLYTGYATGAHASMASPYFSSHAGCRAPRGSRPGSRRCQ